MLDDHHVCVEVSFVRDENKKEACFPSAFVVFSLSLSRSLSCSLALQVEADEPTDPREESVFCVFWTVDLCLATHFFAACVGFRG